MKTSITCLLICGKFTFFFALTYNFLCLQGTISHSRTVFFFWLLKVILDRLWNENSTMELTKVLADLKRAWPMARFLACFRCSDSRARQKNSRRKKNEGTPPVLSPTPRFPGVQFNSFPTDRHALLSDEPLKHATRFSKRGLAVKFASLM